MAKLKTVKEIVAGSPHNNQTLPQVIVDVAETNYRAGVMNAYAAVADYLNDLMWETSREMNDATLAAHIRLQAQWDLLNQLKCDCIEEVQRKEPK